MPDRSSRRQIEQKTSGAQHCFDTLKDLSKRLIAPFQLIKEPRQKLWRLGERTFETFGFIAKKKKTKASQGSFKRLLLI